MLTILTAALLGIANPASPPEDITRIEVETADLNLSTARGRQLLDQRIIAAAGVICDIDHRLADTNELATKNCMIHTRNSARKQVRAVIARATARSSDAALASR
jgi:UrcA family protein